MQIAKMFASLGFNIDMGDLNRFEALLKTTKNDMQTFGRHTQSAHKSVTALTRKMVGLNNALNGGNIGQAVVKYQKAFNNYSANVARMQSVLNTFIPVADNTLLVIKRVTIGVDKGAASWINYRNSVSAATISLESIRLALLAARAAAGGGIPPIPLPRPPHGGGGGGNGGGGNGGAGAGQNFIRPLMPTGMGVGGALGSGYAVKALVAAGREVQRMDSAVLAVSRNAEDYAQNLEFIRSNADRLGIDFVELGQSYGKTFAAAKNVMTSNQVQQMFAGITEYMTAVKLGAEDQKGALRAVAQMFSKDVVQAEEARQQFGERIPDAMKLMEKAAKNAGYEFTDFNKAMKDGMFKPAVLMAEVGKLMRERANNNNALAESLKTSAVQQTRFTNAMKAFAGALLKSGLDSILTDIFNTLTSVVKTLSPLVLWLAKGVSGVIAFSKANTGLAKAIGVVILALIAMRSQAIVTGVSMVAMFMASVVSATLAGGAIAGLTILFRALKGAIIASGIGLLLLGLVEAGTAYNDYLNGKDSWIGNLLGQLKVLRSSFELLGFQAQAAWDIIKTGGGTATQRSILLNTTNLADKDGNVGGVSTLNKLLKSEGGAGSLLGVPLAAVRGMGHVADYFMGREAPAPSSLSPSNSTVKTEQSINVVLVDSKGNRFPALQRSDGFFIQLPEVATQ